ncbi:hypothetical protein OKW27_006102 [Paraburkholderia sp. 35.1]
MHDAHWKPSLNGDLTYLEGSVVNQRGELMLTGTSTILVMPKPDAVVDAQARTATP